MRVSYESGYLRKASSENMQPEQIYGSIKDIFPGEKPMLAPFTRVGKKVIWEVPTAPGEVWKMLGEANPTDRQAVRDAVGAYKRRVNEEFGLSQEEIDAVFSTPNDDETVFYSKSTGTLRVCITAWDFVKSGPSDGKKIILDDLRKEHQAVTLGFLAEGKPAGNFVIELTSEAGTVNKASVPSTGKVDLGDLKVGLSLRIRALKWEKTFNLTVEKGTDYYEYVLAEPKPNVVTEKNPNLENIDAKVLVMNSEGNPEVSFSIDVKLSDGSTNHLFTDKDGRVALGFLPVGKTFSVTDTSSGMTENFTVVADREVYIFQLDDVPGKLDADITLKVVDEMEKPVFPGRMSLIQNEKVMFFDMSQDGMYNFPRSTFETGVPIEVKVVDSKENNYVTTEFNLLPDEDQYVIQLASEVVAEPEPENIDVEVVVVNSEGNPEASFPIDVKLPDGSTNHLFTDKDGRVALGSLPVGETFSVTDTFSGMTEAFTVEADRKEYVFQLDYVPSVQDADITLRVVDEKEKPVFPGRLSLSQNGKVMLFDMSQEGVYNLSRNTFETGVPIEVKVVDSKQNKYGTTEFKLLPDEDQYVIQLESKGCAPWKVLLEILLVGGIAFLAVSQWDALWKFMNDVI